MNEICKIDLNFLLLKIDSKFGCFELKIGFDLFQFLEAEFFRKHTIFNHFLTNTFILETKRIVKSNIYPIGILIL